MMSRMRLMGLAGAMVAFLGAIGVVAGQTPPVTPPAEATPKAPEQAAPPAHEPTLDELLGLKPAVPEGAPNEDAAKQPADAKPQGVTPDRTDLNRKLEGDGEEDDFSRAVTLMGDAAKRLADGNDAGLATQRLQEDVLKSLDKLISDAQKNQSKQKSNQKKQQQQQQPSPSQPQKSQQPAPAPTPANQAGTPQIPREDGAGRTRAGNAASWGGLPARVRDALVEGINDRFSARYRQKTEEYYKRLAESRKPGGSN